MSHTSALQNPVPAVPACESSPNGVLGGGVRAAVGVPHAGAGDAVSDQPEHADDNVCRGGPPAVLSLQAPPQR